MNTLRNTPYLLCPQCKGRVRVDATAPNGVAKCPVCQEAGLLAMHHSGMAGRLTKRIAIFCALTAFAATAWMVLPGVNMMARVSRNAGQATDEPVRHPEASQEQAASTRTVVPSVPVMAEEQLSSSILPGHAETTADYHEVARLHRMVAVSAARMEELRKSFAAAVENSKLNGMFAEGTVKNGPLAGTRAIEAASSLAADYQAECEQVARDLRMAISEAAVSESARELGLGFCRTMVLREQSLWQEVMDTCNDGMHAAPAVAKAMQAGSGKAGHSGGKAERAPATGKSEALAALDKRWSAIRGDLLKPAVMPPLPSPRGIAIQEPARLRGSK